MVSAATRLHRGDTRHQTSSKLDDTGPMHASELVLENWTVG
jgi:hypothetical protein